jgi:hypothetical protein
LAADAEEAGSPGRNFFHPGNFLERHAVGILPDVGRHEAAHVG